jgi:hypothetical protein
MESTRHVEENSLRFTRRSWIPPVNVSLPAGDGSRGKSTPGGLNGAVVDYAGVGRPSIA